MRRLKFRIARVLIWLGKYLIELAFRLVPRARLYIEADNVIEVEKKAEDGLVIDEGIELSEGLSLYDGVSLEMSLFEFGDMEVADV